jgi:hypothetical protein
MKRQILTFALSFLFLSCALTRGAPIPDLVSNISTGIDPVTGQQLANNASDSRWIIGPGDGYATGQTPIARSDPLPSIYIPDSNSTSSRWIAVYTGNGQEGLSVAVTGIFYYQTSIDLTGYSPSTALITGRLAADDAVVSVQVNGVTVYTPPGGYFGTEGSWTALPASLGLGSFSSGVNTITFDVYNSAPYTPEAFRLEAGVYATPVPEPASVGLVLAPAALLLLHRRRFHAHRPTLRA